MKFHTLQVPTYWVCEPCKSKWVSFTTWRGWGY